MQLQVARLCLDCDEVHDQQTCPLCSSESFAYISRWVPAPERKTPPQPAVVPPRSSPSQETADTYRQILSGTRPSSGFNRWMKRGALGLAAVSIAGWAWSRQGGGDGDKAAPGKPLREPPKKP